MPKRGEEKPTEATAVPLIRLSQKRTTAPPGPAETGTLLLRKPVRGERALGEASS